MQLNMEQKKLIHSTVMGQSMIKGVAGSGKTTVAVHRIPFLLNNYCFSPQDRILMVTFNKSLTNYIEYIYEQIEEDEQYSLFDSKDKKENVRITNIDKLLFGYFRAFCKENKRKLEFASSQQEIHIWERCIFELRKSFDNVKILNMKYLGFLKKEISWIKACNLIDVEAYQVADRLGRTGSGGDGPQKLMKNSPTRQAIHELMVLYTKALNAEGLCDFQDVGLYALKYLKTHTVERYTHIIIDESQDLSKVQLECLMQLYDSEKEYSSIMFVADTAQSIYNTSWLIKGRSFTSIGLDMKGKSTSLAKNYRTTTQIAEAAYSLIESDGEIVSDDNFVKPSLIDKQGVYPVFRRYNTLDEEIDEVERLLEEKLVKCYELKEIAVVARTKKILEQFQIKLKKEIKSTLYSKQDGIDFNENTIKLLTMHSIKGLEFKVVILIGLSDKLIPNQMLRQENDDPNYAETMERKLLYVGMTRATERLYMSCHGEPSRFISCISPEFLKLKDGVRFRSLSDVPMKDYLFADKIADPYNKEEKIRQWVLKELRETYHYPIDLLGIEFRVQTFSKAGFVDIVVFVYKNNKMIPYIFIETKQYRAGIESGEEQLKSYMAVTPENCYGMITDGNSLKIFEKDGSEIEDIPVFDTSMLPSSIREYQYVDLVKNKKYSFLRDEDCPEDVIINCEGVQHTLSGERVVRCPVFADIAAGSPIEMQEEMVEICTLPFEWLSAPSETFLLTVKGNSMINADIENGDYVVLRRTNTVDNGQIAAIELDGNVTLKRFRSMGSFVLLIPENDEYEPMMVNTEQFRILGKAVGIMKASE
ncbi:MAG: transcriptional repressor LexA [Lachnospiraceae bacterium]|nr:transcriptional repressor LexA [Lachnospiraceae bacterium]